ncbi:MAG: hypothetical protein ACWA5P_06950 [bacterium]
MINSEKIRLLEKLLSKSKDITVKSSSDPKFKAWKNLVERTLLKVFGEKSPEIKQFRSLRFFYRAVMMTLGADYSDEHRQAFERDLDILISSINEYIDEFKEEKEEELFIEEKPSQLNRVFISHASKDSPTSF